MNTTEIHTRHTRISSRRLAYEGKAYEAQWIGVRVVHVDYWGVQRVGTITEFDRSGYPIITFDDGISWARGDLHVEIVEED